MASMRASVLPFVVLGALAAGPLACVTAPAAETPAAAAKSGELPAPVLQAVQAGDYAAAEKALIQSLGSMSVTPDNREAVRLAMLLDVIRTTDAAVLTEMAKDKDVRKFLTQFAKDEKWQSLYLGCGLVPYHKDTGMRVMYRIWKEEKGNVKEKRIAVALASCWGGGETAPDPAVAKADPEKYNPVWRYLFFCRQASKGLLYPGFASLRPWELRFVVSNVEQDWDDASYEYLAKHINVPYDQYGEAYGIIQYLHPSKFGDSVHNGTFFYQPYPKLSIAEVAIKTGGVCGTQSHLGAIAAMAHGIPAYTCGQPGHCAYGVRFKRNSWTDGIADYETHEPNGEMHNRIFSTQAPTSVHLMETVFGNNAVIDKAYREAYCARALAACGKVDEAIKMWQQALITSPFHPFFRRDMHKLMIGQGLTPQGCFDYLCKTIPLYVTHGFAAADMTEDFWPLISQLDDEKKMQLMDVLHTVMSGSKFHDSVRCDKLLAKQDALFSTDEMHRKFLTMVYTRHLSKGDGYAFGQFLEYGVENYLNKGKEKLFGDAFDTAVSQATRNTDIKGDGSKPQKKAYTKTILSAGKSHSVKAFQAISAAAVRAIGAPKPIALSGLSKMPGKPVTGECLVQTCKSSYWDEPWRHIGLTTPEGGGCYMDDDKRPYVIIELDNAKELTGCIIRKSGNGADMQKAIVGVGTDGKNYTTVASIDQMPEEWDVTFPAGTRAKFVRLEFDNSDKPRSSHLSHFLVFKKS